MMISTRQKLILLSLPFVTCLPLMSVAAPCVCPVYNYDYSGTVQSHSATVNRSQSFLNGVCTINAVINVSTFLMSKTINQTSTINCDNSGLVPQTFMTDQSGSAVTTPLTSGVFDQLALGLLTSNALGCPSPTQAISLFTINGPVPVSCTANTSATVSVNNSSVLVTQVTYASSDGTAQVIYSIDNQGNIVAIASPQSSVTIN